MSLSMAEGVEKARVELNKLTGLEISSGHQGKWRVAGEVGGR
jgi:hypothetical protein